MNESEADIRALQAFHGTSAHKAILNRFRKALASELAWFLANPWDKKAMYVCHCRAQALLQILSAQDFRLDNIDIPQLSSEVVSQFETSLPRRVDFNADYAERNSEEV